MPKTMKTYQINYVKRQNRSMLIIASSQEEALKKLQHFEDGEIQLTKIKKTSWLASLKKANPQNTVLVEDKE